jgi:long-chain-fatty-acid--[acyl-carrier-protein] ligase
MEDVKVWEQGMIYVSGSSIFNWYLDSKIENPFEIIDGKQYYKTGDLWIIDTDWYLSITGRLKRFIKIAWEMISLPFVEWILLEKYWNEEELKVAIEALEKDWSAKIVLFSIEHIEVDEVNEYLRKRWVSKLVKVTENIVIEKIPVLGTGKTDYKNLKGMISF